VENDKNGVASLQDNVNRLQIDTAFERDEPAALIQVFIQV